MLMNLMFIKVVAIESDGWAVLTEHGRALWDARQAALKKEVA